MNSSAKDLPKYNGISVIIPVYNSQDTLDELTRRIIRVLEQTAYPFEILFINDHSKDKSWEIIQALAQSDPRLMGFDLSKNFGQINATMCGLRQVRFDLVLTIDDDLQHPPEEIPKLLFLMETGDYDVVYGIYDRKKDSWLKTMGSHFHNFIYNKIFHKPADIRVSSFRIFGPVCLEAIRNYYTPAPLLHPIVLSLTSKIGNVTINHEPSRSGATRYSFTKLFNLTFDLIFYYSVLPIKYVVRFGMLVMVVSFLSGIFVLIRTLYHQPAQAGWASLWVLISFSCGTIIALLGIIGEYMRRVIDELSHRPAYVIHAKTTRTTIPVELSDETGGRLRT